MKLNRKFIVIVLCILIVVLLVGCRRNKKPEYSEGLEYVSRGDGTCYVGGIGDCTDTEIKIPTASPEGDTVIGIGEGAFQDCYRVTAVELPETVTHIGTYAFSGCILLENVRIPDGVRSIGESAFVNCNSLESVNIPEGITAIEAGNFVNCFNLVSITIPSTVTSIGDFAFMSCSSLVEICNKSALDIDPKPNSNNYLGNRALHIYTDESESRLHRIGDCVFYDDGSEVLLVKYLGKQSEVTLPLYTGGKGYKIHRFAFCQNPFVTRVVIPDGVTEIADAAFESCLTLTSVVIPRSVTAVNDNAFFICYSLREIVNESSLSLDHLGNVITDASKSCIKIKGDFVFYDDGSELALVKYLGMAGDVTLPEYDGRKYRISKYAFTNMTSNVLMKNVVISDSVTSIDKTAFSTCLALESVVIGDGVVNVEKGAFVGCTSVKYVTIGKSVAKIDDSLLTESKLLLSITVDGENTSFKSIDGTLYTKDGKTLIRYAPGRTDTVFVIPNGVTVIKKAAALNASSLTTLVIPEGVTEIGERAFYGCGNFTKVVIPRSVKTVGKDAFINLILALPDGSTQLVCYYTGTEAEWKTMRSNNSKNQHGLPFMANYNYVPEE